MSDAFGTPSVNAVRSRPRRAADDRRPGALEEVRRREDLVVRLRSSTPLRRPTRRRRGPGRRAGAPRRVVVARQLVRTRASSTAPVAGDHSSAACVAALALLMSWLTSPPVASTLPSGSIVRLRNARGKCHRRDLSQRGVRRPSCRVPRGGRRNLCGRRPADPSCPPRRILPGWYITADPASVTRPSTVDHVWVCRFSDLDAVRRRRTSPPRRGARRGART